jgi:hypothetical protein
MTQTEFFAHVNSNNYADNINIWYTGSNPSTVLGMSIPTVTPSGQDISAKLAQAEQVTIPQPIEPPLTPPRNVFPSPL